MMRLFNTLNRRVEIFKPLKGKTVGLYTCGPTVYNYAHIGNLRTYVFEDLLKRTLNGAGFRVNHVMNITDVGHLTGDEDLGEDKIESGARREGKSAWDIARFYTAAFKKDLKALNILPPARWCTATSHIKEQIALIRKLEAKGYTYRTEDGIYFDTKKFKPYGALVGKAGIQGILEGARVEKHPEKRNATDFALWKFSPPGQKRQMEWPSPWGVGFPGWHIECSAMSLKYLGDTFDIHCGGIDHIPIHHTNEIAQSEAATGKPFVRVWMHGEFLTIDGGRMGKSEGNFIPLHLAAQRGYHPLAYRYLLLQTHYRKKLSFSWDALDAATQGYQNLIARIAVLSKARTDAAFRASVQKAFEDDLNAPAALGLLWTALKSPKPPSQNTIFSLDAWFGLDFKRQVARAQAALKRVPARITALVKERETARRAKDWQHADALRATIAQHGWSVDDTPRGPVMYPQKLV